MSITNTNEFILNPLHPNLVLECTIVKVQHGLFNHSWEVYTQNKFLMTAQKIMSSTTKYKVYSNKSNSQNSYIGRIQSNFVGTEWFIFDDGINPDRSREL